MAADSRSLVVFAKSYKNGGWCVAGREIEGRGAQQGACRAWVRPVSGNGLAGGAVPRTACLYPSGSEVQVLDVVEVPVLGDYAMPGQPENVLLDPSRPWRKRGRIDASRCRALLDQPEHLWRQRGAGSAWVGQDYAEGGQLPQSLYLVEVQEFAVVLETVCDEGGCRPRIRAGFSYRGARYSGLSVTDPRVFAALSGLVPPIGSGALEVPIKGESCVVCLSLGPAFGASARHFKLVATVFDSGGRLQGAR
jgi:hypothetical protein